MATNACRRATVHSNGWWPECQLTDHPPEWAHRRCRPSRSGRNQLSNLRGRPGTRAGDSLAWKPPDPGPRPPAQLEKPLAEVVGAELGLGVGQPLTVQPDRALRDLPPGLRVRRGEARQRHEAGEADPPVHQMLGEQIEPGNVVGDLVLLEDLVEGRLGRRAGAVAVVQLDDRPG